MHQFSWVSGQLTEVQRFINVPMRWCEQYPARERREIWVTTAEGEDFKFVVHTCLMPARRGHRVVAVLEGARLVGLHNQSTGEGVNFVRTDPPLLWRRYDAATIALLVTMAIVAGCAAWTVASLAAAMSGLLYGPCAIARRWLARASLARATEYAVGSARGQATGQASLRRVK